MSSRRSSTSAAARSAPAPRDAGRPELWRVATVNRRAEPDFQAAAGATVELWRTATVNRRPVPEFQAAAGATIEL